MDKDINLFELYGTDRTVTTIQDASKIKIMHFLSGGDKSFDEIVSYMKKSKSTVSDTLASMEKSGLVASKKNAYDGRRKIYSRTALLLGASARPTPELYRKALEDVSESFDKSFKFMNSLFRSIRYIYSSFGIDVSPTLRLMGENVGIEVSKNLKSQSLEDILPEIAAFWEKHNLGRMSIESQNPLTIIIRDCYECSDMGNVGKTLCAFDEGILKSVFDNKLGACSAVKEIECAGTGFSHCKFIVLFG